jgi:hypothetical protein
VLAVRTTLISMTQRAHESIDNWALSVTKRQGSECMQSHKATVLQHLETWARSFGISLS